jgi:hypothetical protein
LIFGTGTRAGACFHFLEELDLEELGSRVLFLSVELKPKSKLLKNSVIGKKIKSQPRFNL